MLDFYFKFSQQLKSHTWMESNKEFFFMTSVLKSVSLIKTALEPAFPLPGISKLSWTYKKKNLATRVCVTVLVYTCKKLEIS